MSEEKKPFWAKCTKCAHIWACAYYPMDMSVMTKLLKGLHCPMCAAGPKEITMAKQDNGVLKEPQTA